MWGCLAWGAVGFVRHAAGGEFAATDALGGSALAAAWALRRWEPDSTSLARLASLGAVSFGIYAVALPIQFAQRALFPSMAGTPLTFAVRLIFVIAVSGGLAWLLERRLHPWLRGRLAGNPPRNFPRETRPPANSSR